MAPAACPLTQVKVLCPIHRRLQALIRHVLSHVQSLGSSIGRRTAPYWKGGSMRSSDQEDQETKRWRPQQLDAYRIEIKGVTLGTDIL
jgi:hypothetical protein